MKQVVRICAVCRKKEDRNFLIKITKLADNTLKINPTSKELGRSVYLCKNPDCIKTFIKKNKLKSALKFSNSIEIEKIEGELSEIIKTLINN